MLVDLIINYLEIKIKKVDEDGKEKYIKFQKKNI